MNGSQIYLSFRRTLIFAALLSAVVLPLRAQTAMRSVSIGESTLFPALYGNVDYFGNQSRDQKSGFRNGGLDFFVRAQMNDRWSALTEVVMESDDLNALHVDVERVEIRYKQSTALNFSAGRMHNPLIRWNITQHHAAIMATPIDRPAITRWEDSPGILPAHFVGLSASGKFSGPLGLSYESGFGNGRGPMVEDVQMGTDTDNRRAFFLAGGLNPAVLPELEMYLSTYIDHIPDPVTPMKELDWSASLVYTGGPLEVRGEYARMRHRTEQTAVTYRSSGWYLLVSHTLPGSAEKFRPYILLDNINPALDEAYLNGAPREKAWVAGVRFDAETFVALKLDYRMQKVADTKREGVVRAQVAFSF